MPESDNTKKAAPINSRVILVDRFLDGEEADYIEFIVEEGLRENAIGELKIRDEITQDTVLLDRDNAQFLEVEVPDPVATEEDQAEILASIDHKWSTTVGVNYKLSRRLVEGVIDSDITELL